MLDFKTTDDPTDPGAVRHTTRYDVFLSYSSKDVQVAVGVQRALHRIGRRAGQLRALRVFRDKTDLTPGVDLPNKIQSALDSSRYLAVICSPNAAQSVWVSKEVQYWLTNRGQSGLMLILSAGDLIFGESAYLLDSSTAAPRALATENCLNSEPLHLDVTDMSPWDPTDHRFRDEMTGLAAAVRGIPKSDLVSEDLREQGRFRRLRRAAVTGLILLTAAMMVAAGVAVAQRQQAVQQRDDAVSMQLVALSAVTRNSNPALALALASDSRPRSARSEAEQMDALVKSRMALDKSPAQAIGTPLIGHSGSVTSLAISLDGTRLASASLDGTVRVWDTATRQPVGQPFGAGNQQLALVALSGDGGSLAAVDEGGALHLWRMAGGGGRDPGRISFPLGHTRPTGLALDSSGSVAVSDAGGVLVIDGAGLKWRHRIPGRVLGFDQQGRLAVLEPGNIVRLRDAASGGVLSGAAGGVASHGYAALNPSGTTLALASPNGPVLLVDPRSGRQLASLPGHTAGVNSVAFSSDGQLLASAAQDGTVRLWAVTKAKKLAAPLRSHTGKVTDVVFTASGVLASGSEDWTIQLWQTHPSRPDTRLATAPRQGVRAFAFSPDGGELATAGENGPVQLWDVASGTRMGGPLVADQVTGIAWSPDGRRLAATGTDDKLRIWDSKTHQPIGPVTSSYSYDVQFTPDGTHVLIGSGDGGWGFRDVQTGAQFGPAWRALFAVLSPDGRLVATAEEELQIRVWDAQTHIQVGQTMTGHSSGVSVLRFSPDSRMLVSGSWDSTLRLWDARTGQPAAPPLHGAGFAPIVDISFSPDGRVLAASDGDERVQLWSAHTGLPIGSPLATDAGNVAFRSDGALGIARIGGGVTLQPPIWDATSSCFAVTRYVDKSQLVPFEPLGWASRCYGSER